MFCLGLVRAVGLRAYRAMGTGPDRHKQSK